MNPRAQSKADMVLESLRVGAPLCRFCLNIFEPHERPFAETVHFRSVLMIPDAAPTPMTCDGCFEKATGAFNGRATVPGTANNGPANLVLQQLG